MELSETDVSSFDGTPVHVYVGGKPDGRPTLLLHGFASDSIGNFVRPRIAQSVAALGRRVVLADARGHGQSGKPHDPTAYADNAMAKDFVAVLDAFGLTQPVDVVGYSMGAFNTLRLASIAPERVRSIVLGGIGGGSLERLGRGGGIRNLAEALETDDPSSISDPTAKGFRVFAEATGADRLALAAMQRSRSMGTITKEDLAAIAVPALVAVGAGDDLAGSADGLAALIPGAKAVTVPGDHLGAVAEPELSQAITGFLRDLA